ncbi:uncharacterized protein (DUF1501 family) [Motilibacter rhizosphaerae]|uniref:Uncharacterized protein (DUF1501 family) n=1 Tax=Motilibacter rhizosphaerae TaxID=598652 RepID=A0A4Q7NQP1_9ACTN|nr:DUF1501 domain-containing protein [Motilibacter rhizosphaerae]RZS89366.1 uncharacterized protein (DUF1501 family) [Motilibacter rhizosphaerae]
MNPTPESGCGCAEDRTLSRRRFLTAAGLAGAAALPMVSTRAAWAASGSWSGPVLLVLSLRGGMDGLSTVVPVGDPDYARKRPGIGVPASVALPTGDRMFGLHPKLAPLLPLWQSGRMAAVHAVGTPDGSRSHFQATEELERAAPGTSVRTGWLDRVLAAAGTGTVYESVHLGAGTVPALLAGPAPALAMNGLAGFALEGGDWITPQMTRALRTLHAGTDLPTAAAGTMTLDALATAQSVVAGRGAPQNGAQYPSGDLGSVLADAATLVRSGLGLQALTIDVGDWDMHNGLGDTDTGWMATKLAELAAGLAAFAADLGPLFDRVTVLTISEFGRRVAENGSGGVDHGHGNAVLLLGGGLVGGRVHGTWPGLADAALDDGDLAGTTDYRNVLAEVLVKRMGLSTGQLGGVFPGLPVRLPGAFAAAAA